MLRDATLKFTRELTDTLTVQKVSATTITVNGLDYSQTIAITPQEVIDGWQRKSVEELMDSDFEALLALSPEIILLGTGEANVFPPRELMFAFARRGIGLECMDTKAAARTFNVLASEGRHIAAVLYI